MKRMISQIKLSTTVTESEGRGGLRMTVRKRRMKR